MRGMKKLLQAVTREVSAEISDLSKGGHYAAGLASEGYAGGYLDALYDVLLALNDVETNRRSLRWWQSARTKLGKRTTNP